MSRYIHSLKTFQSLLEREKSLRQLARKLGVNPGLIYYAKKNMTITPKLEQALIEKGYLILPKPRTRLYADMPAPDRQQFRQRLTENGFKSVSDLLHHINHQWASGNGPSKQKEAT